VFKKPEVYNKCIVCLAVLILAEVGLPRLDAQGATAAILGTVTDMSGAAIPEASVQVRNVGTGTSQSTVSDAQGRFNLPDLVVGGYEVQASRAGFATMFGGQRVPRLQRGCQVVLNGCRELRLRQTLRSGYPVPAHGLG
jgi:hypothetical protein